MDSVETLPLLTAGLPGVGGMIKRYDEDFLVEEIPSYAPGGQGSHTYFMIEKRGLTTLAAIRSIAGALNRGPRDIGYAGLKDAHGVTRQMLSVEDVSPSRVCALSCSRIRVLMVSRHSNKIKLGHLRGNRFVIKIRECGSGALVHARPILDELKRRGVPNYFGPQRFGSRGDNAEIGRAVLRNDYEEAIAVMLGRPRPEDRDDVRRARALFDAGDLAAAARSWPRQLGGPARVCRALLKHGEPRDAWRAVDHTLRKLYVSAVQSALFNRVLGRRIESLDRLRNGDLAWKHANGACFLVTDEVAEQPRCDAFEISPTGPLYGRKMKLPRGSPGELEDEILAGSGLTREQLRAKDGTGLDGARRPLRVPIGDLRFDSGSDDRGSYFLVAFALPKGAYATNVTRELCKPPGTGI